MTTVALSADNQQDDRKADINALSGRLTLFVATEFDDTVTIVQSQLAKDVNEATFKQSAILQTIMHRIDAGDKPSDDEAKFVADEIDSFIKIYNDIKAKFASLP